MIVVDIPTLPKISDVAKATSIVTGVPLVDLYGERRTVKISQARWVVWYIARHYLLKSYPTIGKCFRKDHTTVMHGIERAQAMIDQGQGAIAHHVLEVRAALQLTDERKLLDVIAQWEAKALAESDQKLRAFAFAVYRDLARATQATEAA